MGGHHSAKPGETLLATECAAGTNVANGTCAGIQLSVPAVTASPGLELRFADGHGKARAFSAAMGPSCTALLANTSRHTVGIVADAGPELVTMMVDGVLCDGGGVGVDGVGREGGVHASIGSDAKRSVAM